MCCLCVCVCVCVCGGSGHALSLVSPGCVTLLEGEGVGEYEVGLGAQPGRPLPEVLVEDMRCILAVEARFAVEHFTYALLLEGVTG